IASIDRSGYGLVQTSTPGMHGRKFFYFGSAVGGQNWMDYLARPGEGKYLEIQSGITPTQNQRFALPAGAQLEWTEAYAPLQLDAGAAHDPTYAAAVSHAADALDSAVPASELARIDAFLREQARLPLDRRISTGEPWGARQEALLGRPLAEGLDFSVQGRGGFWDDLAAGTAVSESNLAALPQGIAISPLWVQRLTDSARAHGGSWIHDLMLAIAALDRDDRP